MPAEVVQRLQEPVVTGSIDRVSDGGFGLSAAKHLVIMAGGSIHAQLQPEGGTTVMVKLPMAEVTTFRQVA